MSEQRQHETVGRYFKAFGDIYLCFRYERRQGFWMRLVQRNNAEPWLGREVGAETCVSERAIGRTYHCIYDEPWDSKYETHELSCECYVCQPE